MRRATGQLAQGWCPTVVDTNGDGRITRPWNEPAVVRGSRFEEDPTASTYDFDPALDTRVTVGAYGIIVNPVDGSVWGAQDSYPGKIVRLVVGDDPPESCIAEVFEVPSERWDVEASGEVGFMPRGLDVDTNGVIWTALSGTNHLASFDRTRCGGLTGTAAHTGRHCAEGWTLHPLPGPVFQGDGRPGRLQLLQLGRPVRHPRPRRERADRHRHRLGLAGRAAAGDGGDRRHARALPAGRLPPAGPGRPHRRPGHRLEGAAASTRPQDPTRFGTPRTASPSTTASTGRCRSRSS